MVKHDTSPIRSGIRGNIRCSTKKNVTTPPSTSSGIQSVHYPPRPSRGRFEKPSLSTSVIWFFRGGSAQQHLSVPTVVRVMPPPHLTFSSSLGPRTCRPSAIVLKVKSFPSTTASNSSPCRTHAETYQNLRYRPCHTRTARAWTQTYPKANRQHPNDAPRNR